MNREEYKSMLIGKGFVFKKTQKGYPGRGDEDVYSHPSYKYNFYVTRVHKDDQTLYGFYTGEKNGEYLDSICPRNEVDDFRKDKNLHMWSNEVFVELMSKL